MMLSPLHEYGWMVTRKRGAGRKKNHSRDGQRPAAGPQQQRPITGLAGLLSTLVDPEAQQRGNGYYRQRRVTSPVGAEGHVRARVRGRGGTYTVSIELKPVESELKTTVIATCTCPYFREGRGCCKHVWAVVRVADTMSNRPLKVADGYRVVLSLSVPAELLDAGSAASAARIRTFRAAPVPSLKAVRPNEDSEPANGAKRGPTNWRAAVKVIGHCLSDYVTDEQLPPHMIDLAATRRTGQLVITGRMPAARAGSFVVSDPVQARVLGVLLEAGALAWADERKIALDPGEPFRVVIAVLLSPRDSQWVVRAELRRGEEVILLDEIVLAFAGGLALLEDRAVHLTVADDREMAWINGLLRTGPFTVDKADQAAFLKRMVDLPATPAVDLPEATGWTMVTRDPRPRLIIMTGDDQQHPVLLANHEFDYDEAIKPGETELRAVVRRDVRSEEPLIKSLYAMAGITPTVGRATAGADVLVDPSALVEIVRTLAAAGWSVEQNGQRLRTAREFKVNVKSGVDWIDLSGSFDFGLERNVELPEILEGLRRGDKTIKLTDGSVALVPEDWASAWGLVAAAGTPNGAGVRLRPNQVVFVDNLATEAVSPQLDKALDATRLGLATLRNLVETEPHAKFTGTLRNYQKQGLNWLEKLDEQGFGGCLADDMGLGKTIQVLAHLQKRRRALPARSKETPTSLIVCPTSLVPNWLDEAARFTPDLKVYTHSGAGRSREKGPLLEYDIVVTSYGTMRSDVDMLSTIAFDYIVLDEAQAIKNDSTQIAKTACALTGVHRLALSGTPVQNRIEELWSIFRFLNPGMLDGVLQGSRRQAEAIARSLRPLIVRRTKEQVLPELPGKSVIDELCVLEEDQRRQYDELAAFYRASLGKKVEKGLTKALKIHVLEALLRLRQMACHPGLIDEKLANAPSAKLDLLMERIEEVVDSGHKCLVFSQFTSLLALIRTRLDDAKIPYEYLDGATVERKEAVDRFQTDKKIPVFLISLKAGGVGLNLTAADYCFILDPWWNPAAEMQAIDRAHRIGQTKHVMAYRLIARGTIEEKILTLQAKKRKMVEGVFAEDDRVLANLTSEEIDWLLE